MNIQIGNGDPLSIMGLRYLYKILWTFVENPRGGLSPSMIKNIWVWKTHCLSNSGGMVFPFDSFLQLINNWTPHQPHMMNEWVNSGGLIPIKRTHGPILNGPMLRFRWFIILCYETSWILGLSKFILIHSPSTMRHLERGKVI